MINELGNALREILAAFGIEVACLEITHSDVHLVEGVLCTITGLVESSGEKRGILSLEFDEAAASFLLGSMIGDPEGLYSEMGLSALSELTTMLCGSFLTRLNLALIATPPTGVVGRQVQGILNTMPVQKIYLQLGKGTLAAGLSIS